MLSEGGMAGNQSNVHTARLYRAFVKGTGFTHGKGIWLLFRGFYACERINSSFFKR